MKLIKSKFHKFLNKNQTKIMCLKRFTNNSFVKMILNKQANRVSVTIKRMIFLKTMMNKLNKLRLSLQRQCTIVYWDFKIS